MELNNNNYDNHFFLNNQKNKHDSQILEREFGCKLNVSMYSVSVCFHVCLFLCIRVWKVVAFVEVLITS